jgi:acyl-CoA synthetase (AMP-forming)/AMP-acid ligase II
VDNTGMSPEDRYLVFGPFSHTAGYKAGWISCLISGCTIFATSNYDPHALLTLIHHDRVTIMPSPPTVWQAILTHPNLRDFNLSSLRAVSSGGTVVPVELIRRLRKDLGVGLVATGYGMTECCGSATVSAPDDDLETIANTVGRPIPGTEMCTIRTDSTNCSVDEPGEILIRDRKLLLGYLDDPEATAAAFTADGWFKTGDVGVFDERGYLKLTGRLKDMFIVGGFNVYSAEVENVLGGMPGIMHVSVIGVPDERLGEVGQAFIVPAPGVRLSEEQVTAYARDSMANYKVPRSVKFLSELPLNASGKVQKSLLRTLV